MHPFSNLIIVTMKTQHYFFFFFSFFLLLPATLSVEYEVINDAKQYPGSARFEAEIGAPYTLQIMKKINNFVWNIFQQKTAADRKPVQKSIVYIQQYDGAEAITYGDNINVSALYLEIYKADPVRGSMKWEFTSLLYHEMTHVFQWDGEGTAPVGLVEGVADYSKLESKYYPPAFAKPGSGDRWDQGYDFTARFLEYCDALRPGFVAALNRMMRHKYSDDYFRVLTGKTVDHLWKEYKAKYANKTRLYI